MKRCPYLVKAWPPRAALEFGGGRVGREITHGAVEGAPPFRVVLDSVRETAREGRFSAPADHVALLDAQFPVLWVGGMGSSIRKHGVGYVITHRPLPIIADTM